MAVPVQATFQEELFVNNFACSKMSLNSGVENTV